MNAFRHLRLDDSSHEFLTLWIDLQGRRLNVLEEEFFSELDRVHELLIDANHQKPVVIRSAKAKGFVVGADLRRILQIQTDNEIQAFLKCGQDALNRWEMLSCPTIAWIEGAALGGGLELALACRYRVASPNPEVVLSMPETKLGLTPGWGGTQRLIPLTGLNIGARLLLMGESIDLKQALAVGLIDAIWDTGRSDLELIASCRELTSRARNTVRLGDIEAWKTAWTRESSTLRETILCIDEVDGCLKGPARAAILKDIEAGLYGNFEDGLSAERTHFFALLNRDEVQVALRRFEKPKNR